MKPRHPLLGVQVHGKPISGLNERARRDTARTLVDDIRPSVVCLLETKLNVISRHMVYLILGISYTEYAYLPASNTRGGILIAARDLLEHSDFDLLEHESGGHVQGKIPL